MNTLGSFEYHQNKVLLQASEEEGKELKLQVVEWEDKFNDNTKKIYPFSIMESAMDVFEKKVNFYINRTVYRDVFHYFHDGNIGK